MPVGGVFRLSGLPVPLVVVVEEIEVVDEVVEEVVVEAEETEAEGEAEEAKAEEKVDGVGKVALDVVVLVILMANVLSVEEDDGEVFIFELRTYMRFFVDVLPKTALLLPSPLLLLPPPLLLLLPPRAPRGICFLVDENVDFGGPDEFSGVGGSRRPPRSTFESIRGRPRPVESMRGRVASKLSLR